MAANGYDFNNPHHHFLLLSLIITSCDLSINVKMFEESSVIVRDHIYSEFFSEGEILLENNMVERRVILPLICRYHGLTVVPIHLSMVFINESNKTNSDILPAEFGPSKIFLYPLNLPVSQETWRRN